MTIPFAPRTQPVKVVGPTPVYEMTSVSIAIVPVAANEAVLATLIVTEEYWITPVASRCEAAVEPAVARTHPVSVVAVFAA